MTKFQIATLSKLVREWEWQTSVGIYENCTATIRLYEDRCIVRTPAVRWQGNTGNLHTYRARIDRSTRASSAMLDRLLKIAGDEANDGEDYTDVVRDAIASYQYS